MRRARCSSEVDSGPFPFAERIPFAERYLREPARALKARYPPGSCSVAGFAEALRAQVSEAVVPAAGYSQAAVQAESSAAEEPVGRPKEVVWAASGLGGLPVDLLAGLRLVLARLARANAD